MNRITNITVVAVKTDNRIESVSTISELTGNLLLSKFSLNHYTFSFGGRFKDYDDFKSNLTDTLQKRFNVREKDIVWNFIPVLNKSTVEFSLN